MSKSTLSWCSPFEVPAMSYEEALATLKGVGRFGISPLLETVEDMLAELAHPDRAFRSVQVVGTNGKTSTSRYTAAILAGEGFRVALYTSPELVSYTERMEIDGKPISEELFARGIALAMEAGKRVNSRRRDTGERPYDITEFDLLTVGAVCIFADAQVDVAVLECGMGGRWDATSAVESIEAVAVTGVGLDHIRILGDTLEEIASEKAAVIKPGRACVLGAGTSTPTSVEDVFLNQCAQQGVTPTLVRPYETCDAPGILEKGQARDTRSYPVVRWHNIHMPHRIGDTLIERVETPFALYETVGSLKPAYQAGNIACAIALAEVFLGRALNNEQLEQSIVLCPTPGRFDVVRAEPLVLVDACHNPQSIRAFLSALDAIEPDVARRPALLVAVFADKDVEGICELLAGAFPRVYVTATASARALPAHQLAQIFEAHQATPQAVFDNVGRALDSLTDEPFIACGSISLAGEIIGALR